VGGNAEVIRPRPGEGIVPAAALHHEGRLRRTRVGSGHRIGECNVPGTPIQQIRARSWLVRRVAAANDAELLVELSNDGGSATAGVHKCILLLRFSLLWEAYVALYDREAWHWGRDLAWIRPTHSDRDLM